VAREVHNGNILSDYTMLTVARDSKNLRYFYNTHDDQTLRMVDLSKFDFNGKSIKKIKTNMEQPIVDMSNMLK